MPPAFDILTQAMDAISASLPQYVAAVAFYGDRPASGSSHPDSPAPSGATTRKIGLTLKCVVVEDNPLTVTDAAAPVHARAFTVRLPRSSWPYPKAPEVGEWLKIQWRGEWLWTKANQVGHMPTGDLTISAIQTQEEMEGPPWLR